MFNYLTGKNCTEIMAPAYDWSTVWFFYSLFKEHRALLMNLHEAYGLGTRLMSVKEHKELVQDLRRVHYHTEALQRTIDAAYGPVINKAMAEPEHRPKSKVVKLRPKRPVATARKILPGATLTAPDIEEVRLTGPEGQQIKRRRPIK